MVTGDSRYRRISLLNLAIVTPSMTRWSALKLICKRVVVELHVVRRKEASGF
jgi:hypothetical protein